MNTPRKKTVKKSSNSLFIQKISDFELSLKSLIFISILGIIIVTIIIKNKSNEGNSEVPYYVASINENNKVPNIKLSLDVTLTERINESELKELANLIYKKYDGKKYESIFILYWMENMLIDYGAYASTHYNPNLEVRLLGICQDDIDKIKSNGFHEKRYWCDDDWKNLVYLSKEGNQFYLNKIAADKSSARWNLNLITKGTDTIFEVKERRNDGGEFYKTNDNGDLELFDYQGIVSRMIKG